MNSFLRAVEARIQAEREPEHDCPESRYFVKGFEEAMRTLGMIP